MKTMNDILQKIEEDRERAEKYLLSGRLDKSNFARAVVMVESELSPAEKCLLESRREIEKDRKYKSRSHWVIKTQFTYNKFAEQRGLSVSWISESKIKREWRAMISRVAEIAVRM